ncbi:hypothetical protein KAU92_02370, partial [Candidatus Bathyarchaeota archaeon]|nr:hypothetical protein [Candidatus Bathyarchaeota archaeon]
IHRAFCVSPADPPEWFSKWARDGFYGRRHSELKRRGLVDDEIREVDTNKYTVFMPTERLNTPVKFYAAIWEELGHVAAWTLGVDDRVLNESVALAHSFKGLLKGVKEGRFSLEEAIHQIECDIKGAELGNNVMSTIEKIMGLKPSKDNLLNHYHKAFFAVREFNPQLKFRNRSPHELMVELDKIIDYVLGIDRRRKTRFRRRAIPTVAIMIAGWLIFLYALSFFGK